jgi:hypothetical protein
MECELAGCDAEAEVFRPVLGVMRHVCHDHAYLPKPKRPTLTWPAVSKTPKDLSYVQEKYTKRRRQRPR